MKIRKVRKFMLAIAVITSFVISNAFAFQYKAIVTNAADDGGNYEYEEYCEVGFTCSQEKVSIGDKITITANISLSENLRLGGFTVSIGYTESSLKLVSADLGSGYKEALLTQSNDSVLGEDGKIIKWWYKGDYVTSEDYVINKNGTLFSATFIVTNTNPAPLFLIEDWQFGEPDYSAFPSQYTKWHGEVGCNGDYGMLELDLSCAHKNISDHIEIDKATCDMDGTFEVVCNDCGEVLENGLIPAKGHNFGAWKVLTAATTDMEGKEERVCSACNEKEIRIIPKLGTDTEEPSTEAPPTEEPSTEAPSTEVPPTEEPSTETPTTEEPSTGEPTTEKAPIATPTDVNNTTGPKTGDGAMPMGAAVLGILSLVSAVVLKRKHKSL